jgi:hypothetical protein
MSWSIRLCLFYGIYNASFSYSVPFGMCSDQLFAFLLLLWIYFENCGVELLLYGANLTLEQGHKMILQIHK